MVNPVPGWAVTTPYRKQGSHWQTCGWHTGQDYAAPAGTTIVAARGGQVVHVDYGDMGNHQFVIRPGDGTEDFYAHTTSRPGHMTAVDTGDPVAKVGSEGNSTGPHLHLERHTRYGWECSLMADPMLSHDAPGLQAAAEPPTPREADMILITRKSNGQTHLCAVTGPAYIHTGEALAEIARALTEPGYAAVVDDATFNRIAAYAVDDALPY